MRHPLARACGLLAWFLGSHAFAGGWPDGVRIATFNLEDVNAESIEAQRDRMERLGHVIRAIDPDIILLNEVADGLGQAFVERFVTGADGPQYRVFQAQSNTGVHSGFDLDNNAEIDVAPGSRTYAGDCWGYGEFPGQYAMALLVRADGFEIMRDDVRTFRGFLWNDMPGALLPPLIEREGGAVVERGWYAPEERAQLPLSSKSHWDVPVRLPSGAVLHVLASHPTPPVFDGPEDRNGRRNHDEIRFWGEYLSGAEWIVDDSGAHGGLAPDAEFVILGDLNADPDEGDSHADPITKWLMTNGRVNADFTPISNVTIEGRRGPLDRDDTARFGLRVDYVLPSRGLSVVRSGVVRGAEDAPPARGGAEREVWDGWDAFPSDHFPVWIDAMPPGAPEAGSDD